MRKLKKKYYNKIEIRKNMNNKYCDVCFFCETPIYLRIFIYLATKPLSLWINKYGNLHY